MRRFTPLLAQARSTVLPDPFKILEVPKNASSKEIKQAYFALVKKHHPDRPASTKPKGFDFKVCPPLNEYCCSLLKFSPGHCRGV
jgi:hypothetical protein